MIALLLWVAGALLAIVIGVLAIVLVCTILMAPFWLLTSISSSGPEREPIVLFSRHTWSWLVPAWRQGVIPSSPGKSRGK
jgi:hypothetical protein